MKKTFLFLVLFFALSLGALLRADAPASLVPNSSFEDGTTGWAAFIPADSQGENCRFSISQDSPHSGQSCALMQADGFARFGVAATSLPIHAGEHYRVSAWVRGGPDLQFQPGTAGILIRLTLSQNHKDAPSGHFFIALNGAVTLGSPPAATPSAPTDVPTQWTQVQAVVEAPADADTMGPVIFFSNAKGSLYIDDFTVEKVDDSVALTPVTALAAPSVPHEMEIPSTSDADLLEQLRGGDASGMEKIKAALASGDLPTIQASYLDFRRNASKVKWTVMPGDEPATPTESDDKTADAIINHLIPNSYGFSPKLADMGKDFDWTHNPVPKSDPAYTDEWTYCAVSRTQFWDPLVQAYWTTHNEKYAQAWVDQMEDFVRKNPIDKQPAGTASLWRTLDASGRMDYSWPNAYFHCLNSPAFTPEAQWIYIKSVCDHAHLLLGGLKNPNRTGNWVASECFALYSMGVLYPELKDAAMWRQVALDRLTSEAQRMVPPDGMEAELTPGYHLFTLSSLLGPIHLAKLNGLQVPQLLTDKVISMYRALVLMMDQGGNDVPTNDSGIVDAASLAKQGLKLADDPLLEWVATRGEKGTAPPDSTILPYAGFYAMRSGWKPDDLFLFFRAGPTGIAHQHEDMLEIALQDGRKTLLFDPGTYPYDHSDWRRFTCGTASHSTIIVDGKWQHRGPSKLPAVKLNNPWAVTPLFNYVAGTYDSGYQQSVYNPKPEYSPESWVGPVDHTVTHTRRVLFLPPYYALVLDTVDGTGHHTFDAHFQLGATGAKIDANTQAAFTADPAGMQLALYPLDRANLVAEVIQGQMNPLLGWIPVQHRAIPTVRFRKVQDAPAIFATFLYPYEGAAPEFQAKPLAVTGDGTWGQAITTAQEQMETALVKNSTPEEISFTSALAGDVHAQAAGVVLRQAPGEDIRVGGWELQSYSDDKTAFSLDAPVALAFMPQGDGRLFFNGGDADAKLTLNKPFAQTVVLPAGAWTLVTSAGASAAAAPTLFKSPLPSLPGYQHYLESHREAATPPEAAPIVIEAASMKLPSEVTLVDKVGAHGPAISHWDQADGVISKQIDIPVAGWYRIRLRYCSGADPERSLLIDGKVPFAEASDFLLDSTVGDPPSTGWSSTTNDWHEIDLGSGTATAPDTAAVPDGWKIFLPKGPVQIGLRNDGGGGANIDRLTLEPVKS